MNYLGHWLLATLLLPALAIAAEAFLDAVDQNLAAYGQSHGANNDALANSLSRIDAALQTIEADLIEMSTRGEENADAA